MDLREYQLEGAAFLANRTGAVLADEMGLGKTVQAAKALELVLAQSDCERAIVIAPASLQMNWERELSRWAPSLSVHRLQGPPRERQYLYLLPVSVLIATYEQIRADAGVLTRDRVKFGVALLDEAQRIRNGSSRTSLACKILPRQRSWALTGTPLENRPEDLVSLFAYIQPGLLRDGMALSEVHQRMRDHFLRRTKAAVLADLPQMVVQDLPLELTGAQREAYDALWTNGRERRGGSTADLLALITGLKQICNRDPGTGQSVKLDALRLILEPYCDQGSKVLVFSQYVETIEWLVEQLRDLPCSVLHGGMSQSARDYVVQDFETSPGPKVLFISLKAGGVGLNLNSASAVVLFDRWWNPAVEDQAVQRAHRFGRLGTLHVVRFIVYDTIEERIQQILQEKREIFDDYVEGAPVASASPLTGGELRRVLEIPEPPAID